MKVQSQIKNVKPEPQPNSDMKLIDPTSSPTIGNTNVGGRCGQIRKTSKRFDLEKKMWRESYILFNFLELIVYKIMKGYPSASYKIITKYKLKFYDGK
jgi:hypothetical protein